MIIESPHYYKSYKTIILINILQLELITFQLTLKAYIDFVDF